MFPFPIYQIVTWAQLIFQDAASPVIEEFLFFHDFALVVLTFILVAVGRLLTGAIVNKHLVSGLLASQRLETIWTAAPALILIQVAVPSLLLLYSLDEAAERQITLKVVGHQWYWSYEYSDFASATANTEFDAYMLSNEGTLRLLETDNRTVLPWGCRLRVLVGSADVLHAWTIPSIGVKTDACPGRLNQLTFNAHRPGVFFGQCSEICGANHRFMPICLELVSGENFLQWLALLD